MGVYDIACIMCGGPCYSVGKAKVHQWVNKWMLLTFDGSLVKCEQYNHSGGFKLPRDVTTGFATYMALGKGDNVRRFGIGMHQACHKFIKDRFGIELRYNHFNLRRIDASENSYAPVDYKPVSDYWGQAFEWDQAQERHPHVLLSPLTSEKNAARVARLFAQFKIKKEPRPSPMVSASMFAQGDRLLGGNGRVWLVRQGRWVELQDVEEVVAIPFGDASKLRNFGKTILKASFLKFQGNIAYFSGTVSALKAVRTHFARA